MRNNKLNKKSRGGVGTISPTIPIGTLHGDNELSQKTRDRTGTLNSSRIIGTE